MDATVRVTVVVDVHEPFRGVPSALSRLGVNVVIGALPIGDYDLGRGRLVERKRVLDMHVSIRRGRFWPQLLDLRRACPFPYLLIEGSDLDRGPLYFDSIRAACLASIELGVPVLRSAHQAESALWVRRLAIRAGRRGGRDRPRYAQRPIHNRPAEAAEAMLAAVPGISTVSARALLDRFGSVAAVFRADPDEWISVPGIGPERARRLVETLSFSRQRREKPGRAT